jgi:xanthosine utilization system XapX-like protein
MTNCPGQLLELIESLCQVTVTAPPQLSLVVTLLVLGAGTSLAQLTVRLPGQAMFGGVASCTVMVWVQVALLPH